jgi:2-amino-4-hydroxy-6-hydroxymethyldihydropteridine diphosphokinase
MSLILATGSNIGDREHYLKKAELLLSENFKLIAKSLIYESAAVEYTNQDDFLNQVLEFELPLIPILEIFKTTQAIELEIGRQKTIAKGPRAIDIDILFWGTQSFYSDTLNVPHPSWADRSFVVLPLQELPFFQTLKKCFTIPSTFKNTAYRYRGNNNEL